MPNFWGNVLDMALVLGPKTKSAEFLHIYLSAFGGLFGNVN